MKQIKCPKCGEQFTIDESGYADIVKQVRDDEFNNELKEREKYFESERDNAVNAAVAKSESKKDKEIAELKQKLALAESENEVAVEKIKSKNISELASKDQEIQALKSQLELDKKQSEIAVKSAVQDKDSEIIKLKNDLDSEKKDREMSELLLKESHAAELQRKDEEIAFYKDFKARQSTKMIGESLEQHCMVEFEKLRPTAFRNAYFEKDNDAKTGSKGDFIYREKAEDDIEFISIMFEMKNEADTTSTKHKNEHFFKELDKDRNEKNCEYAVLVSMLEPDSELYNTGIVDVSHKYEKMYVIRPQFFILLITILRNAALNSLSYKRDLIAVQNQNLDISKFEADMMDFKADFSMNVERAGNKFKTAIEEIDKTIDHLQKVKDNLLSSDKNLQIANRKVDKLSIKSLTKDNPTMKAKFDALKEANSEN